jgi:hypothetical protein
MTWLILLSLVVGTLGRQEIPSSQVVASDVKRAVADARREAHAHAWREPVHQGH